MEAKAAAVVIDKTFSKESNNPVSNSTITTKFEEVSTSIESLKKEKQDKITDLEEIRRGAAKGATALQSVPDEFVTEEELSQKLTLKVDKVAGKQLSTEDFTTALKNKLQGLSNYDDTAIKNAINNLIVQIDTLVSGNASKAIESFNEIIAFLNGIEDSEDLDSIIASIEQQIADLGKVSVATLNSWEEYNVETMENFALSAKLGVELHSDIQELIKSICPSDFNSDFNNNFAI